MELRSIWTTTFPGWIGLAPVLGHGRMYVRAAGLLVCLDPATGREHWRVTVDPENDTGRVLAVCEQSVVTSRHVNRTTRLIGVDLDGGVGWETQTDTVVVDAYGCVGDRFLAFGARGRDTLMHAVNPGSGAVLSVTRVQHRPDRFFAHGGRLYCTRRLPPGMFSLRADDGTDQRVELTDPVFGMTHHAPPRLLITKQDTRYSAELRDADLRPVWTRPVGSGVAALHGKAVAVVDIDEAGAFRPLILRAGDGTPVCRGPALPDEPRSVAVLDRLVAIGDLTDLRLFTRDDLTQISVHSLARHAVQAGPVVVITQTDRIEGFEVLDD
jgi:hypothetical protein